MVTVNYQVFIPTMKADSANPAGKEKTVGAESFLSFLDKSLSKPLHVLKGAAKAGENAAKPLYSARSESNEDVSGTNTASQKGNTPVRAKQPTGNQSETQPEAIAQEPGKGMKTEAKAADAEAEEKTEEPQDQNLEQAIGDTSAIELAQKCDQLLAIMDQIIQVLQQAATPSEKPEEMNSVETIVISSKPEAVQLNEELQKLLSDLVETAEQMEGTKTAGHALAFAKKLQQLLGEDSFEKLTREGVEISVNKGGLEDLVGKMLHEAENAKMHLMQTSLQEITIPAMKTEASGATTAGELHEQAGEAEEQPTVHQEKAFIQENSENQVSPEQNEEGMAEKPQLAKVRGRESENATDPAHNTLADAAPNLNQPQKDIAAAVPERPQIFSKAEVTAQIIEKAETMIREDKSEMILQLKPDSLGKISLKIIHERGEIIARFVAESEQVKAVLEGNMQLLKDSLQKSGVMVQSLEVSVGQQGGNQQRGWDGKPKDGFAHSELKDSEGLKKSFVQPTYGYGGFTADYYSGQSSEIDLTA